MCSLSSEKQSSDTLFQGVIEFTFFMDSIGIPVLVVPIDKEDEGFRRIEALIGSFPLEAVSVDSES